MSSIDCPNGTAAENLAEFEIFKSKLVPHIQLDIWEESKHCLSRRSLTISEEFRIGKIKMKAVASVATGCEKRYLTPFFGAALKSLADVSVFRFDLIPEFLLGW